MFEGSGSGGSGGGAGSSQMAAMLQGYATQSWVDENYVGIEFFNRLFRMHGDNDTVIVPNDLDTTIQNIEARFGLWTESFLSALGLNSGGGGGGSVSYLNDLLDVSITNPTVGEGLIYDGTRWVNGPIGGGGTGSVESVGLSMPTGFSVTGSPVTTSGTLAVVFASGYSLPPTSKQAQWDAAYSWGDHSQEGYATQSWVNAKGYTTNAGTVTSVRMTVPAGLTVTGSPITTSGTLAISLGTGYSIPTTAKQSHWDTAYGWGNHADAGYAAQTALAAAVTRITTLEGYFTNGSAKTALRLADNDTHYAWGQPFWQNGVPKNIGSASARANINYAGSVSMGWSLNMEYDDAVHDPSINIKSSKTGTSLSVFMLSNSATSNHSGDHLAIGWGTSAKAQLPIRFFGREFVFNFTTDTVGYSGDYQTAEAMKVGYRSFGTEKEPAVYVRKHLMIGNGAGDYFPVTYDSANNALCFTGNIYATGGISALGFQATPGGGTLFDGPFTVNGAATLNSSLTALGATTLNDTLTVTGAATFRDSIYIYYGGTRYTLSISKLINQGLLT